MINEIPVEEKAWISRADPRVRLLFAVAFSFLTALSERFVTLAAAVVVAAVLVSASGISFKVLMRRMLAFNGLVLLFWLFLPVTFGGEAIYTWKLLSISKAGVLLAGRITLKSNAITMVFMAFVVAMPVSTLAYALQELKVPAKIVQILLLTYRYVFVIEQEYQRLVRAMKTRGFVPGTNLHTYRTYAYLAGMIFVRSVDRAQRVSQAMICRGFAGRFYALKQFCLAPADYGFGAAGIVIIITLGFMEWMDKIF